MILSWDFEIETLKKLYQVVFVLFTDIIFNKLMILTDILKSSFYRT